MPLNRVALPSPNYSSRDAGGVRLIVIHTAEGALTYQSLGNYFASSSSGVSSHAGIDDTPNTIGVFVRRTDKAWTAANANPYAVQAELCAFAEWDSAEWNRHQEMLRNCARWVAEEAAAFGIPIVKLTPAEAQGGGMGLCQHADLGSWGGGHWDCGPSFPIDQVLEMATGSSPAPAPSPTPLPPAGSAPPFPYPPSDYLGEPSPDEHCHSGCYGGVDEENVATWQAQMIARGWTGIGTIDGCFGPSCSTVALEFQTEATGEGYDTGGIDGLVGEKTWALSWTKPVT